MYASKPLNRATIIYSRIKPLDRIAVVYSMTANKKLGIQNAG